MLRTNVASLVVERIQINLLEALISLVTLPYPLDQLLNALFNRNESNVAKKKLNTDKIEESDTACLLRSNPSTSSFNTVTKYVNNTLADENNKICKSNKL